MFQSVGDQALGFVEIPLLDDVACREDHNHRPARMLAISKMPALVVKRLALRHARLVHAILGREWYGELPS